MNGIQQGLRVVICEDPHDAIKRGYLYRPPVYKPIRINEAVVVKGGAESGNSTVDLVLEDEHGQKYALLIPSALLKSIPAFGPGHE